MNTNKFWAAMSKALAVVTVTLIVILMLVSGAAAQTYKVLYTFTGGTDGAYPEMRGGGPIFDVHGNLYGTNVRRGNPGNWNGQGVVFQLTPNLDGTWSETSPYIFCLADWNVCSDGAYPTANLVSDTAGDLYGITVLGGIGPCYNDGIDGCGVVFKLAANPDGSWTYSPLYKFTGGKDGALPFSPLAFDSSGNLYGTTYGGGGKGCSDSNGCGVVFELTPKPNGGWTQSVLHRFTGGKDGAHPDTGNLVLDGPGNVYGSTFEGGASGYGVLFELTPRSGGGWKEVVLHSFRGHPGRNPIGGLTFDPKGNLYGTTSAGGAQDAGAIFELTPGAGGKWTYHVLHVFNGKNGRNPWSNLIFDQSGNLYGTTSSGGREACGLGCGVVFKLTPQLDGKWKETILHKFTGGNDGGGSWGALTLDAAGNLYGTTNGGSPYNYGVVFEITP